MRRHVRLLAIALAGGLLALGTTPGIAGEPPARDARARADSMNRDGFQRVVMPFLATHCASCHGAVKPKGGLNLETLRDEATLQSRRRAWARIREYIEGSVMPPEDSPQPDRAESEKVAAAIKSALDRDDCGKPPNPGRVTIRRLNRAEYNNTIRDLFGVEDRPADEFPSDDVGYGFDNVGDVLGLPPLLMERYMAAAEKIAGRVIVANPAPGQWKPDSHRRIIFREPASAGEYPDAARAILERFASRAYRRPVTPAELDRLLGIFQMALSDGERFERAIQFAVQAVLVSPNFLFRVELDNRPRGNAPAGPDPGHRVEPVGEYEVASRLSYFLWSSMPDEDLFRLAAQGKLRSPEVLSAQVRRMIVDPGPGRWWTISAASGSRSAT